MLEASRLAEMRWLKEMCNLAQAHHNQIASFCARHYEPISKAELMRISCAS